jgi:hypothetical protein
MRKAISVLALVLALTCSVQAGYMANDSPAPPPSQPATSAQEATTDGEIPNKVADGDMGNDAATTFIEIALNLLALS